MLQVPGGGSHPPGRARIGLGDPLQVSNRIEGLIRRISTAITTGARAIFPVDRTTPLPALYRESGLLPPRIELDHIAASAMIRLQYLGLYHPPRKRVNVITQMGRPTSRFARRELALPPSEQINPL